MAFPDDRDRRLQIEAYETLGVADELIDWIGTHNPVRKSNGIGAIRIDEEFQLLALHRKTRSMFRSSKVPVAAAVYGPSQVGKSLFVGRVLQPQDPNYSPLGRDENAGSPAYYPHLSFDLDLNPRCGQAEATALVSRFTTKDRFDEDAGKLKNYAVLVRGLSRSEWLRVLARGFCSECAVPDKKFEWHDRELEDLFIRVAGYAVADAIDREWRMDLLDVYSYLKRLVPSRYKADEGFFNGLLSRYALSPAGYTELAAALCWWSWPELTELFQRINTFLEKIRKHGRNGLLCHWAAVRFLLDSQQKDEHESPHSRHFPRIALTDIVDKYEDGWYVLDYQPGQGPPREQLTTIQSAMLEMVIPVLPERLSTEWRGVLAHMDFLDIPGLKPSGEGDGGAVNKDAKSHQAQMSVVKRGKVFYLFERYIDELQAQALLMLVRGATIPVRGYLKSYVDKWGHMRYGEDHWPQRVPQGMPALFLGMTGIDEDFEKEHPTVGIYEARMNELVHNTFKEVMTDFGGAGQPFTNVYVIRYDGTLDSDEQRRKLLGAEKWELARKAFLASALVQRYVGEAPRKWAAAMREGDGGTSLLAEGFRQVASSERKQDELAKGLVDTRHQLVTLARMWFVDPNVNKDRAQRSSFAGKLLAWLTSDSSLVNRRVLALKNSLCFEEGEIMPVADLVDIRTSDPDDYIPIDKRLHVPIELRLRNALGALLRNWGTNAPKRWHDYTTGHSGAGQWLDSEAFASLTLYLMDYLTSDDVFDRLCQRLLQVVTLRINNHADLQYARRKFVRLILNDYVLTPGDGPPTPVSLPQNQDPPGGAPPVKPVNAPPASAAGATNSQLRFGLMTAFVERWQERLPGVLAAGAGNADSIPAGNDELIAILKRHRADLEN